ncbi:lysophospholipid acyltransferase family protein [Thiomicrospira microaerophila]|uniref:lysophospholipid acyltransferase family protein n=1 Tax=Thiomicrospira microaerophila TaxID=406020 RepID=UPI00200D3143|nr:lysophospholipid acyltransferase family protein [Thiomicrospira microaerophila]UQB42135.1 lysophospholipid acyltransferase family protein [Thiomicrospira microaerophila]
MKKNNKQKPIQGVLFKGIIRFFSWFPLRWNHRLGAAIGWLLWRTSNKAKRVAEKNITKVFPECSQQEQSALVKQTLIETGKTFSELGPLWLWPKERLLPLVKRVEGEDLVTQAFEQGKGVIVLSPHIGAWEMMGWYWSVYYQITSLYRPPRIGSIDGFMRHVRERAGANLVPTDLSGVKALRRALKANQMIGILPDQDPGSSGGVIAPFFGQPANTMVLVSKLAAKAQCPIFFTYAERLANGEGYVLHIKPASSALASLDEFEAACALNQGVEASARHLPSQYQWTYNRFKLPRN